VAVSQLPFTAGVFVLAIIAQSLLVPITHGPDFVVWDLASRATLKGINVYAHHPAGYLGGPYTYPPLFLYLELPFQWLAERTSLSFNVLGKIPILLGDWLTGAAIAFFLARRHCSDRRIAVGCAMYLLNPLVLYNGAFYGRFDTLCVGLFLWALQERPVGSWRFLGWYATAIGTKIFPVFLLPRLWMDARVHKGRLLIALLAIVGGLSLPYLIDSPVAFVSDVLLYNLNRDPSNLSWQIVLVRSLSPFALWMVGYGTLLLFGLVSLSLKRRDLYSASLIVILAFFLLSKVLIEQYFLWVLPFLILAAVERRSWAAAFLFLVLSTAGMMSNHDIHPFGEQVLLLNVAVALSIAAYLFRMMRQSAVDERKVIRERAN
jgi:Gpi18-like mannosyltransferase